MSESYITVYRLGHPDYIDLLDGKGAAIEGARWNRKDEPVVYTAQTSSLAILEVLAHIANSKKNIPHYQLITLKVKNVRSGGRSLQQYTDFSLPLPEGWTTREEGREITQKIGSSWIKSGKSAVLQVPSVLNPLESNFLLNPKHPDFDVQIMSKNWYLFDHRLVFVSDQSEN